MNDETFAAEIREREKRRRRKGLLWDIASVVFHVALFAAIILATPARDLLAERKKTMSKHSFVRVTTVSRRNTVPMS